MPNIIPADRLSVNGYEPGVGVGVPGGIEQYRDRPITINAGAAIPGTTQRVSRHAETCLATGVNGSDELTVNDASLLVVGNVVTIPGVIRVIQIIINTPPGGASANGNITITINEVDYVIPVTTGQSPATIANTMISVIPSFAPPAFGSGSNPYYNTSEQSTLSLYFKDFTITDSTFSGGFWFLDMDFGATGCSGYAVVDQTPRTYGDEITAIGGGTVTVTNPVGTAFTDQVLGVENAGVINFAISQTGPGEVCFIPVGLYVLSSDIGTNQSNRTIRGAGSFVESKSTVTIGTGTKVFTVVAGLDYEVGVGVRVETRQYAEGQLEWYTPRWMMGRVISYSGTTLTVNVTAVSGSGTFSNWKCSLTMFLYAANTGLAAAITGASLGDGTTRHPVAATSLRGANTVTLESGLGGNYASGQMVEISIKNSFDFATNTAGVVPVISPAGYDRAKVLVGIVTNVTGDVLTIDPPFLYDLPLALEPNIASYTGTVTEGSGLENFAIRWKSGTAQHHLAMAGVKNCWIYDVESIETYNYNISISSCVHCEFRRMWVGWRRGALYSSNGAGFLSSKLNGCLLIHCIAEQIFPPAEFNFSTNGCAALYCTGINSWNVNHGAQNSFNLHEGCYFDWFISDGYFGGSDHNVIYRNHVFGAPSGPGKGRIILRRMDRRSSIALNVVGWDGGVDGEISLGLPNIGNESYTGEVTPSLGDIWPEIEVGYKFTISNKISDNEAEMIMSADAGLLTADLSGNQLLLVHWANGDQWPRGVEDRGAIRVNMSITDIDGDQWTMRGINSPGGPAMPVNGTEGRVWLGAGIGFQQLDHDVALTAIRKKNYMALAIGTGAQEDNGTPGETEPASIAYPSGTPPDQEWVDMELAFPPYDAAAPVFGTRRIPAHVLMEDGNGVLPPTGTPPDAPSSLTATTFSASRIDLAWTDNSADESGFKIYRGTVTGELSLIATLVAGTTTYSATGLASSTTYFFAVRSYGPGGNSTPSNEDSDTTSAGGEGNPIFTPGKLKSLKR